MKKKGILNSDISRVVADMGHMDWLAIGDAGTPVPRETEKIDLSIKKGLPSLLAVLDAVLDELAVEKIYLAEEIKQQNPAMLEQLTQRFGESVTVVFISHIALKQNLKQSKAFIRTGEETPFANIILESGVIF
ncbi:D-ribose pyranase [Leuconostoc carnosum]|uniref:D-ribose pyranase n=1 Tax=Leuconostoc TaxID=1243 RepID=UPI000D514689|nr:MULTISPECIES: D-ribose pyranase [Leuconostoc]KAA8324566.1 D-ribose pyranase [Leuconostoc carnosum]KAA8358239.1 D-ribose pyranase [Leuconostoc carnosum]KAA8364737.1 D-ribose pyranase [Leuconostoc carnosum]KAA8365610.1 D-ribose pyranase [Leuconostoc carnosum]KAA8371637.1 D-ribose pyranase [Leuconostoc carnosum]